MKKVIERYPVDKLPEELRRQFDCQYVRIEDAGTPSAAELAAYYGKLAGNGAAHEPTPEEVMDLLGLDAEEYKKLTEKDGR